MGFGVGRIAYAGEQIDETILRINIRLPTSRRQQQLYSSPAAIEYITVAVDRREAVQTEESVGPPARRDAP